MRSDDPFGTEAMRVIAVRKLYARGGTMKAFAKGIGLTDKQWSNFERGSKFSRVAAEALRAHHPNISIDWIWWGDPRGMTEMLLWELREAAKKE